MSMGGNWGALTGYEGDTTYENNSQGYLKFKHY